jgi:hypothetical protein
MFTSRTAFYPDQTLEDRNYLILSMHQICILYIFFREISALSRAVLDK